MSVTASNYILAKDAKDQECRVWQLHAQHYSPIFIHSGSYIGVGVTIVVLVSVLVRVRLFSSLLLLLTPTSPHLCISSLMISLTYVFPRSCFSSRMHLLTPASPHSITPSLLGTILPFNAGYYARPSNRITRLPSDHCYQQGQVRRCRNTNCAGRGAKGRSSGIVLYCCSTLCAHDIF